LDQNHDNNHYHALRHDGPERPTIDRPPQTGDRGIYLKQQLKDNLIEHRQYIDQYGEDLPEIRT
jgi:phosphoketolase